MPAATYLAGIGNPKWDWCYRAEPDPTRGNRADAHLMPDARQSCGVNKALGAVAQSTVT